MSQENQVRMEPLACQVPWVLKATRVQLEQPVPLECPVMENQVPMVRREREVPPELLGPQVQRVSKVTQVLLVPLVPLDPLAQLDLRVHVASQVRLAPSAPRVIPVQLVLRVLKDTREIRELRDSKGNRATLVQLVPLAHREPRAHQEPRDMWVFQEPQELQVFQDLLAQKDTQDVLVSPAHLVLMVLLVKEDLQDHRVHLELLV